MSMSKQKVHAVVPFKYSYLLKDNKLPYIYASDTGLFHPVHPENHLIQSLLANEPPNKYQIIDNFNSLPGQGAASIGEPDSDAVEPVLYFELESDDISLQKNKLLNEYRKFDFKSLLVDIEKFSSLFEQNSSSLEFNPLFRTQLDELALFCNVEILISSRIETFNLKQSDVPQIEDGKLYIYILGDSDDTIFAETRLRILMDNTLGMFVDSVDIPLSLLPVVGGVNFGNFKSVAKETGVNLYLPTILPELFNNKQKHKLDKMFLSGIESQVFLAKKLMMDLTKSTSTEIYYKNLSISKLKKDSILINHKNEVSSIIYKYGVFIQMSPLGHADSLVHFQGTSNELIELAINEFIILTAEIVQTNLWFTSKDDMSVPSSMITTIKEINKLILQIAMYSNTSITTNIDTSSFELIGTQKNCLKAIEMFKSYSPRMFDGDSMITVLSNIELGLTYHDFISGKKNGKIVKIMNHFKTVEVNFKPLNDYSLIITLKSTDLAEFLSAFSQLQQEFPSEFKFYIPESFHRQIIGTGGSLIQSIMRKYNVFIKFSNSYELKSNLKSHTRYDNVIIRCPSKNSSNIPLVKNELNSLLINNENFTFSNTFCKISRSQYRLLNFDIIQTIEKKTSTFIRLPNTEPVDFVIVEILGLENHSINAARLLINELAESYEIKVSSSPNFKNVVNEVNESYLDRIKVPFKLLYNFEILTVENKSTEFGPYHSIILTYPADKEVFLEDAIAHLTSFLREAGFMIIDRNELANSDSIINGSAARYSQNVNSSSFGSSGNINTENIKPFSSVSGPFATQFSKYPSLTGSSAGSSTSAPSSHQLYQLPKFIQSNNNYAISQSMLVQPLSNNHNNGAKRSHLTPIGHSDVHGNSIQRSSKY